MGRSEFKPDPVACTWAWHISCEIFHLVVYYRDCIKMIRDKTRVYGRLMHSDQIGKDGISEPMIQALYYDFVANYVKTRMYDIRYDAPYTLRCTTREPLRRPPPLNPSYLSYNI